MQKTCKQKNRAENKLKLCIERFCELNDFMREKNIMENKISQGKTENCMKIKEKIK